MADSPNLSTTAERACIIGAGSSGIACVKALAERGVPFDCFELSSGIGGNWRYGNDNGLSSAYRSLHINTSRDKMCYSDFPMPEEYPDFPHHTQVLEYFERYVDHFGLREKITFRTEVTRVAPASGGGWEVTTRGRDGGEERTRRYGAVLVANGHHWCPNRPTFPGSFEGTEIHSHDYKTPDVLEGRRVLVVGVGNSGCDIVCEAARHAEATFLSTRRGAHVVPKYILGQPLDAWTSPLVSRLPFTLQRKLFRLLLLISRGSQKAYGFPTPRHPFGSEHPTISSQLLDLIGHGKIAVKPNLERREGDRVHFVDGTSEAIDVIVYATGYQIAFPFFEPGLLDVEDNELPLYRRLVHPDHPGLYFIGLLQPLGATMPLAEAQAKWVGDLLTGRAGLPEAESMRREMAHERRAVRKRYVDSPRHTIQVDFYPYLRAVEREQRRGRRRPPRQALTSPAR